MCHTGSVKTSRRPALRVLAAALAVPALAGVLATATAAVAGCPPEPMPPDACGQFGRSALRIDAYGNFEWRASRGPAPGAFFDPAASYLLCAWDQERLVVAADIPEGAECPGGSCWSEDRAGDDVYRDEAGANGDIRELELGTGETGESRIRARGLVIGGVILPVAGGVIVQAVRTGSPDCLESFLPAESFTLDDKAAFAAKFDVER